MPRWTRLLAAALPLICCTLFAAPPLQTDQQAPAQQAPARPKPDASGVYRVGGGVKPPKVAHSVDPRFTDEARHKKINGTCVLSLTIGTDGVPTDIAVVRSIAESQPENLRSIAQGLDGKAIAAVQQYRFQPATLDGEPVPVSIHIEVRFQIF